MKIDIRKDRLKQAGMWGKRNALLGRVCCITVLTENLHISSKNLRIELPYDLAISLLGINLPTICKNILKNLCTPRPSAALSTIDRA